MSEGQGQAGVPYLGSKISLISKAEIRYEGTLYTIDPQEATVALAKVRSFGTEDRPTDRPVAPRNEVFEFIIFRGQDIKDLNVCEPPQPQPTEGVPLDPAIVRSSQPPPTPVGTTYPAASSGLPPGQLYHPSVQPLEFEQQSEFSVPPPLGQHQQVIPQGHHLQPSLDKPLQPSQGHQQQQPLDQHLQPSQDQHLQPTQEQHLQPSQGHQQQPPQDQHLQPSQGLHQQTSHRQQSSHGQHQQTSHRQQPSQGRHQQPSQGHHQQPSQVQHHHPESDAKEPRLGHSIEQGALTQPPPAYAARSVASSQVANPPYGGKAASNHNAQVRPDSPENGSNTRQRNNQQHPPPYHGGHGLRRGGGHYQNSNVNNRGRNDRAPEGSYSRERGNNRVLIRGGPHRGGGQWGASPGGHQGGRPAEPLKFDTEFDFESSNAQFTKESIDKELKNLSLGDKPVAVGDKEEEESEDEVADESEVVAEEEPVYYNKSKSFFDNISCEATEPSKGQRFSWNEGRKLNSETFGIKENFRRNYRGRGNWRGGADHGGFGGGQGAGRWRGESGFGNSGWSNRGRGGFYRENGGNRYGGNAGANGQGRRNWGYDDRTQKESHPRVDVRS